MKNTNIEVKTHKLSILKSILDKTETFKMAAGCATALFSVVLA